MAQLDKTFPTLDCSACILTPKMVDVANHPNIELLTYAQVEEITGYVGNFDIKVRKKSRYVDVTKCTGCGDCAEACRQAGRIPREFDEGMGNRGAIYLPFPQAVPAKYTVDKETCLFLTKGKCGETPKCQEACKPGAINFDLTDEIVEFKVGTLIVATGFDIFDAKLKPEYAYGVYDEVVNALEFERMVSASGPYGGKVVLPQRGKKKKKKEGEEPEPPKVPKNITFIQCCGSRDKSVGNEYCSRVCCMYTAKQAHLAKDKIPDADITIFYMDVRAFGKGYEEFYDRVRREGVRYVRGNPSEIFKRGGKLIVRAEDTLTATTLEHETDMVVLSVGLMPRSDRREIIDMLKLSSLARPVLPGGPSQAPPGGHRHRRRLPGRRLPGSQGHPRRGGPGQGRGLLGHDPDGFGQGQGRSPDLGGGRDHLPRLRLLRGALPLRRHRAGRGQPDGLDGQRGPGQRSPLQGLRRLCRGLPLRLHPAAIFP